MIATAISLMLYWDAPQSREDGTPLYSNEIAHYQMYHNGEFYEQTESGAVLEMDVTLDGDYLIRAVDTNGLESDFSNVITVNSAVRGNPDAPGRLRKRQ
jgi:hypothetical protein